MLGLKVLHKINNFSLLWLVVLGLVVLYKALLTLSAVWHPPPNCNHNGKDPRLKITAYVRPQFFWELYGEYIGYIEKPADILLERAFCC